MANNTALMQMATQLQEVDAKLAEAEELIEVMRAAGEPVGEQLAQISTLKDRKRKWESALRAKGYIK